MSLSLELFCPSMGGHEEAILTWHDTMSKPWEIKVDAQVEGDEAGFLTKCDRAWRESEADVLGYLHSDLFILQHGWDKRVLAEFEDEKVALVGFVGAQGLGHENIYKVPYDYTQLARRDVWSNLTDAEDHGKRDPGSRQVAVLDSCAIFVRRSWLASLGGWPVATYPNSSHCSDLWICCMAARAGLKVKMVGIGSTHRSGGKGQAGTDWLDRRGGDRGLHRRAHELIYSQFRDILPLRVKP